MISLSVIQLAIFTRWMINKLKKPLEPYGERVQHVSTSLLILEGETWAVFMDQNALSWHFWLEHLASTQTP